MKNKWKNGEVKNIDLWKEMYALTEKINVKFQWVKGHEDNEYNNYVDDLCSSVYEKINN